MVNTSLKIEKRTAHTPTVGQEKDESLGTTSQLEPRFRVGKKIAAGSYGTVRSGVNVMTNEPVAIKLERNTSKGLTLPMEYQIYKVLGENEGIPKVFYFGPCGKYNALVIELLGPNVEKCFLACRKRFTLKTTIQIVLQMVRVIEYVHSKGVVYRDIKPENFLFGLKNSSKDHVLHLVDFGLSKMYIDSRSGQHIQYKEHRSRTGTARYMSVNSHKGTEQSRRDDLESIGYILVYLCRGTLPWQGFNIKDKEKRYEAILNKKETTSTEQLCHGLPPEVGLFVDYVRKLEFYETPDYRKLRGYLTSLFNKRKYKDDGTYDWTVKRKPSTESVASNQSSIRIVHQSDENLIPNMISVPISCTTSTGHPSNATSVASKK